MLTDPEGNERWRLEGYLPRHEFRANLEMGLGRLAMMRKDFADAEKRYGSVLDRYPDSKFAPEAIYWRGVSRYQSSHDHNALGDVAESFKEDQDSIWALKSIPWGH